MQDVHGRVDEEGYGYVGVPQVSGRAYKTVAAPWSLGMALTRHRRLSFPLRYMRLSIQALHPRWCTAPEGPTRRLHALDASEVSKSFPLPQGLADLPHNDRQSHLTAL